MSAKDAIEKYCRKQLKEPRARRKNQRPEQDLSKSVMAWLRENGFSCDVIEAKAVYSVAAGRYLNSVTTIGMADIFGSSPQGIATFIELKAPGRRATLKPHQKAFLESKIHAGAFAVCVDSVPGLAEIWSQFLTQRFINPKVASHFLLSHLPTKTISQNDFNHERTAR